MVYGRESYLSRMAGLEQISDTFEVSDIYRGAPNDPVVH